MAQSNPYLLDATVQRQLAAHNNKLIKGHTVWFPGEDPEVYWEFNRAKEFELLVAFLNRFQEIDFLNGIVTVQDAARAIYGTTDDYLESRIAKTHLDPASGFNKAQMNGVVTMATTDGRIVRGDRTLVAKQRFEVSSERFESRVVKTANSASKSLQAEMRRSLRIAPSVAPDLKAIAEGTVARVSDQTRRAALGESE